MIQNKRILAIIPARGGSKGLPGKNSLFFCGKPLLAWSIEQALKSKYIDQVLVSTDSKKIAAIARKFGAEVPFLRPRAISGSSAKTIDAVFHAVDALKNKDRHFDHIILLQPTSPLRSEKDIDQAIEEFFKKKAQSIISVCKTEHSPLWAGVLPKDLSMKDFIKPRVADKPRQSLPDYYRINGAIYFSSIDYLRRNKGFLGELTVAFVMPRERSIDIDTQLDFDFAAFIKSGQKK